MAYCMRRYFLRIDYKQVLATIKQEKGNFRIIFFGIFSCKKRLKLRKYILKDCISKKNML